MRGAVLAAAVLTLLFSGPAGAQMPHDDPDPSIMDGTALAALRAAEDRWDAEGLRDYRFTVAIGCFCPPEYTKARRITVRDGHPQHPPAAKKPVATVPRLFRRVHDAIREGVAGLQVRYGWTGMPRVISIDGSRMIADDEVTYSAKRLRPIG
jgi:Family of unknown function (DUF6174)